ncbi:uncharacterized protein G2W53_011706 [Senna tora]|uniref:Uncharacterized protein n=1 Tax=Senna tora TaxID=362788 RepID=A0A834X3B4_9FABA|nr:uncharacterized protein G2W53_011706 [Senna tora]
MEDSGGVGCIVTTGEAEVDLNVVATSGEEKPDTIVEVEEERVSIMPMSSSQVVRHEEGGFRFGKKLWISKRRIGRWRSRRQVKHERRRLLMARREANMIEGEKKDGAYRFVNTFLISGNDRGVRGISKGGDHQSIGMKTGDCRRTL